MGVYLFEMANFLEIQPYRQNMAHFNTATVYYLIRYKQAMQQKHKLHSQTYVSSRRINKQHHVTSTTCTSRADLAHKMHGYRMAPYPVIMGWRGASMIT